MSLLTNKQAVGATVITALGLWYLSSKVEGVVDNAKKAAGESFEFLDEHANPVSEANVVNTVVKAAAGGEDKLYNILKYPTAIGTFINPLASKETRAYGRLILTGKD